MAFILNGDYELYVRHIPSVRPTRKAIIFFNSRSLCVESSMGISMATVSYADYLAESGVETFLVDMRGYGLSTSISEQVAESVQSIANPISIRDSFSDLVAAVNYVKDQLGPDVEITLNCFSQLGNLALYFDELYPGLVKKMFIFSSGAYKVLPTGPPLRKVTFVKHTDPDIPYDIVSIDSIQERFATAQPPGHDFREPLWAEQALANLKQYHRSFDHDTGTWKIQKITRAWFDSLLQPMFNIRYQIQTSADILFVNSEFDSEYPEWRARRLYNAIAANNKEFRTLPNATHLSIWEKSRETLYKWTADFVLQ